MLKNAYLLAKVGADTAENERNFAKFLPKIGNYPTGSKLLEHVHAQREVPDPGVPGLGTQAAAGGRSGRPAFPSPTATVSTPTEARNGGSLNKCSTSTSARFTNLYTSLNSVVQQHFGERYMNLVCNVVSNSFKNKSA